MKKTNQKPKKLKQVSKKLQLSKKRIFGIPCLNTYFMISLYFLIFF